MRIFNNQNLVIDLRSELPTCDLFNCLYVSKLSRKLNISIYLLSNIVILWLCGYLRIRIGDVEVNPGPKNNFSECLSVCHRNLISILGHDYFKLFLLKAYILVHRFDIICLSERYLDSTVPLDDENLVIFMYNFVRSDHPSNSKSRDVCLYYKIYLLLRIIYISYLKDCLNFELKIGDKSCNFVALYRSEASLKTILKPLIVLKLHYKLWHKKVLF